MTMKRFVYALVLFVIFAFCATAFLACGGDDDDEDRQPAQDDDDDITDDDDSTDDDDDDNDDDSSGSTWTFVVYMAADNDLYDFALEDLTEMKSVGSTSDVTILVIFDGTQQGDSRYLYIKEGEWEEEGAPGELNMADPQTVRDGAAWAFDNHPADRYALVFWNHGDGWMKGDRKAPYKTICQDDSAGGEYLGNDELDQALYWIRANTAATTIDLIGFDACLMQMVEIAYLARDDARVMVGSEETESGSGWAYDRFLAELVVDPGMSAATLGTHIAQTFVETPDSTQSAVDLTRISALAGAVDGFAQELISVGGISNGQVISAYNSTLYFDNYDYIDLYDFAEKIADASINSSLTASAQSVRNAVDDAVIWHGHGDSYFADEHGLSIYFPDPYLSFYDSTYEELAFAQDTDWKDAIQ